MKTNVPDDFSWIEEIIVLSRDLYEQEFKIKPYLVGCLRDMEISFQAIHSLGKSFKDEFVFVLSQFNTKVPDFFSYSYHTKLVPAAAREDVMNKCGTLFCSDLIIFWGSSHKWVVIFSADLSLGFVLVFAQEDVKRAVIFSQHQDLHDPCEAVEGCISEDLGHLPAIEKNKISNGLRHVLQQVL